MINPLFPIGSPEIARDLELLNNAKELSALEQTIQTEDSTKTKTTFIPSKVDSAKLADILFENMTHKDYINQIFETDNVYNESRHRFVPTKTLDQNPLLLNVDPKTNKVTQVAHPYNPNEVSPDNTYVSLSIDMLTKGDYVTLETDAWRSTTMSILSEMFFGYNIPENKRAEVVKDIKTLKIKTPKGILPIDENRIRVQWGKDGDIKEIDYTGKKTPANEDNIVPSGQKLKDDNGNIVKQHIRINEKDDVLIPWHLVKKYVREELVSEAINNPDKNYVSKLLGTKTPATKVITKTIKGKNDTIYVEGSPLAFGLGYGMNSVGESDPVGEARLGLSYTFKNDWGIQGTGIYTFPQNISSTRTDFPYNKFFRGYKEETSKREFGIGGEVGVFKKINNFVLGVYARLQKITRKMKNTTHEDDFKNGLPDDSHTTTNEENIKTMAYGLGLTAGVNISENLILKGTLGYSNEGKPSRDIPGWKAGSTNMSLGLDYVIGGKKHYNKNLPRGKR